MASALTPQRGVLRTLRGLALAVVTAALAAAAHAAGGGGAPDGALTVLLTVGVAAAGTALADRRRGPIALLGAVAVTQLVLHLLLDTLGGHHGTLWTAGSTAGPVAGDVAMMVAHAAAVVITAGLLSGAESALFTVAAAMRRILGALPLLQAPPAWPTTVLSPASQPAATSQSAAVRALLGRVTPHRGPPLGG